MSDAGKVRIRLSHPGTGELGRYLGYSRFTRYVQNAIDEDPDCDTTILISPPFYCRKIESCKTMILYTMWEFDDLPYNSRDSISQADAIIVPSEYCRKVMRTQYAGPIHVVPLPVDSDLFYYKARCRPAPGETFRWLFLNSMQERKGWRMLAGVWDRVFAKMKNVELYVKIAMGESELVKMGNIVIDPRFVSDTELVELYHSAHGFVYPSFGEGFGWSLAEAVSTGLPAVAVPYSGVTEFYNQGIGFPIDFKVSRIKSKSDTPSHAEDGLYGSGMPTPRGLVLAMMRVMDDYAEARRRAKNGAELIKTRLTEAVFQQKLSEVLSLYV